MQTVVFVMSAWTVSYMYTRKKDWYILIIVKKKFIYAGPLCGDFS